MKKKIGSNKFEKIINKGGMLEQGVGRRREEVPKKSKKLISGRRLLEPLEYKLREEKDANRKKLYCCGRKSCKNCVQWYFLF